MNRTIKFRGKSADGKWHYGDLRQFGRQDKDLNGKIGIYPTDDGDWRGCPICDESTIGQFTGLKDRDGVDVYEGDLIKDSEFTYEVYWCDDVAAFMGEEYKSECDAPKIWLLSEFCKECEVIGNIYDNPIEE